MEDESENDRQPAGNTNRCFPGRDDPPQEFLQGSPLGAIAHRSTTVRDSARVRPQMSLSRSSTFAFPPPTRAGSGRRRAFVPADRLPNVRDATEVRPRRSRTRAVARSASTKRTVTALRVPVALKVERTKAAQRSNAAETSTGEAITRLHCF